MKRLGSSMAGLANMPPRPSERERSRGDGHAGARAGVPDGTAGIGAAAVEIGPMHAGEPRADARLADERLAQTSGPDRRWPIGELARELGVSTRTIRFYETSGLIAPERINGARVYGRRDRARMHIILRGKNLGFSLEDIREYLRLYDDDPNQVSQTQMLMQKVEAAIAALEHKKVDLERTLGELKALQARAADFLARKRRP